MRILELALAGVLVLSVPIAAHANERGLEYEAKQRGGRGRVSRCPEMAKDLGALGDRWCAPQQSASATKGGCSRVGAEWSFSRRGPKG